VDAAGERELARLPEVEVRRQVVRGVARFDLDPGVGEAAQIVGADDRRDAQVRRVLVLDRHAARLTLRIEKDDRKDRLSRSPVAPAALAVERLAQRVGVARRPIDRDFQQRLVDRTARMLA
jgi:hypothetical protein